MKNCKTIENEIYKFKENELILASKLYKQKLSFLVEEPTFYKTLERMCESNKLFHLAKGLYYLPKSSKYGIVPISQAEIISCYTKKRRGVVVGYALYNSLGLTTQVSKDTIILSSYTDSMKKQIGEIVVYKTNLTFTSKICNMISFLDVLENFSKIQDLNYRAFLTYARQFALQYDDSTFKKVIGAMGYKKSTISFMHEILNHYNINNCLGLSLSSLSKYSHPKIGDLYEFAQAF